MRSLLRHTSFIVYCALQCSLITCIKSHQPKDEPNNGDAFTIGRNTEERPKCEICTFPGSTIRNDFVPSVTRAATRILLRSENYERLGSVEEVAKEAAARTCMGWNDFSTENEIINADPAACVDMRDWLSWQCCEGMPSLHECETKIDKTLLSNNEDYDPSKIPITDGSALDVFISMQVTDISIINHGVEGGAVEVSGFIHQKWVDDRLKWNSSEAGCSSIRVPYSKIWTPKLRRDYEEEGETSDIYELLKVDILADGRIFEAGRMRLTVKCETGSELLSKVCYADFLDSEDLGKVNYVADRVIYDDAVSLPGYILDRNQTAILMSSTLIPNNVEQYVRLQFYFRSETENCDICGNLGELYNGTIQRQSNLWRENFPNTENLDCFEINNLIAKFSVHSNTCLIGRQSFTEACCDDTLSSYECETNIHDQIVEKYNTLTPPDPSANKDQPSFGSRYDSIQSIDRVDVSVSLDVIQMIEIDVKSNTLKMLVSLELAWSDQRLQWEPFIGGCYRVSYRASIDAELTEIWVPNLELANMIEGVQSLPEAHASVYNNGVVVWRRTGALTGTCELQGIITFPFDTISCYFDFGEDRDPQFHRVNYYNNDDVQYFASLTDNSWNYQEYRLLPEETEVDFRTENLSGFKNRLIRYRFYFERASNFYIHMFVVTYLLFTYLSFGMFFIDLSSGERLGYGTSILFVIVAQDITLADSAPVTQEFLWIFQLSLGSKCLVIFGIVETLIVQWVLNKHFEDTKQSMPVLEEERVEGREVTNTLNTSSNDIAEVKESYIDENNENPSSAASEENVENKNILENLVHVPGLVIKKGAKAYFMIGDKLTSLQVDKNDSERTKIQKKIKIVDVSSAAVCFLAYSLFVIILGVMSSSEDPRRYN